MATLVTTLAQVAEMGGETVRIGMSGRAKSIGNTKIDQVFVLSFLTGVVAATIYLRSENMAIIQTANAVTIILDPDGAYDDGVASPEGEIRVRATYADASNANPVAGPWWVVRCELPLSIPSTAYSASTAGTALYLNKIETSYLGAASIKGRLLIT